MDNIDVSSWVRSALVIDDKWEEVKNLIQILNSSGVATSYFNPNPENDKLDYTDEWVNALDGETQEQINDLIKNTYSMVQMDSPSNNSISGYNLIFLDIDFGFEHIDDKSRVNYAVNLIRQKLREDSSPYGIVLWSKDSTEQHPNDEDGSPKSNFEYINGTFYKSNFRGKPKPLFIVDIEKATFWSDTANYDNLIEELNEKLQHNRIANFIAYWNREVAQSASFACRDIQHYAEELADGNIESFENDFFKILKHATYTHFGISRKQDDDISDILSRYSLGFMSSLLSDYLNNHFSQKEISGVFKTPKDHLWEELLDDSIILQKHYTGMCKLLEQNDTELDPDTSKNLSTAVASICEMKEENHAHKVLAELNFRTLFAPVQQNVPELPGLIYTQEFKYKARIYINITPPCDIAQGKEKTSMFLSGRVFIFPNYQEAMSYYSREEGIRFFKTPPALDEAEYLVFKFDLRGIQRKIDAKTFKPILILKDSILTDLAQKFGQYNSRLGARTFQ